MRRTIIALAVLLLAGTVGGLWMRSRAPQAPNARPTAATPAGTPAAAAAPAADLMLQVNGAPAAQVSAAESVFFTISLMGTAPEPAFRLDPKEKPWPTAVRFETPDGKPLAWRIDQLGPPTTSRFSRDRRNATPGSPEQGDVALVDASNVHQTQFGVSPDEAARLAPGLHRIRAVLTLPRNVSGGTPLVSNTIALTVQPSAAGDNDKGRLASAARFYLRAEKWEDAHRIALQLVGREGADAEAYILLADSLNGLRRDEEALAAYYEAMASLPAPKESPDYLIARMEEVQQRLEASKGKKE